jgi:hypothetical protein
MRPTALMVHGAKQMAKMPFSDPTAGSGILQV